MSRSTMLVSNCSEFDINTLVLKSGGHSGAGYHGDCCLLEAANRATVCYPKLAKRFGKASDFTDNHPSVDVVVRAFGINLNDSWLNEDGSPRYPQWNPNAQARLRPFILKVLGTATTPEDTETRAWMATDWLARTYAPAFLRLAGLTQHAQALEGLARIVDAVTATTAQPTLSAADSAACSAAYSAACSAAYSAADSAAYSAARSAAYSAARSAAYSLSRFLARLSSSFRILQSSCSMHSSMWGNTNECRDP
jgi:hypothetical protein